MIGKQLKALRKLNNLNQTELAEKLFLKQSTVANYEKNIRTPQLEVLISIADYFNISLDYLVGKDNADLSLSKRFVSNQNLIELSDTFLNYLLTNNLHEASEMMDSLLTHMDLETIYLKLFRYALSKLGWLWEVGAITIAKEHQVSFEITRMIAQLTIQFMKDHKVKSNKLSIIGMAAPGEKHNIGLKMTLAILETKGYNCQYIGEAVPLEDLKKTIKDGKCDYLILSITNSHLKKDLYKILQEINIPTYIAGNGVTGLAIDFAHVKGVHKSYESCLEAIQ